ncbi:MAG: BatA domain-containing protein [Verrucomicrobiales bacterium]|nr:BatA domain-containing protein [Verrucomicrobiales bacterium]
MSFLNPALLAFTAAIAVPILIHFLNRRRFRRVEWAAMRFLRASLEKNRRRMELEDLILLVLRCLVVGLLALALARPALRAAGSLLETGRAAAVIVLDHSGSLQASDGTRSRWDLAREAAENAVDAYRAGSAIAVLLSGDRAMETLPEPTYDLNLVRKTLRESQPSELATDHVPGLAKAAEILRDQTALRKEIVLITDRQALGWRRLPDVASILGEASRDTRLRIVFVGEPAEENLALTSLTRSPGFASSSEPLRLRVEVANRGASTARQVRATLHLNGGPVVDEALIDALAPGEVRRLTFFARLPAPGFHSIQVRLPADRLPADDERALVVRGVEKVNVLVVDGDPESNAAFFLRHALQPVPADLAANYHLQPRVIPPAQVALTRLADYDAIILADVPPLVPPAVDGLSRYVREGGALIVFPGPRADTNFYNAELLGRAGWLPAGLGRLRGNPEGDQASLALEAGPYAHRVFELWNDAGAGSLTAVRFRAAYELTPALARTNGTTLEPGGTVMIRYADGTPAVVERPVERGRVVLFSSTAGTGWNDLAVRPAIVPILHRSVAQVAEAREAEWNLRTGAREALRLESDLGGREVWVMAPGETERRLTATVRSASGHSVLEFDETSRSGTYRVVRPGESNPVAMFAASMDGAESDLTDVGVETRAELERLGQVIDWIPGMDLRSVFDRERVGVELWLPLVIAVLLLGALEVWLAQAFSRSK